MSAVVDDGHIAVLIGATYRDAQLAELGEQQRGRVAVVVVPPDRDDRQLCMYRLQELRIGVRAAVVGDLEHVRADVDARRQRGLLFLHLGITGKQQPQAADRGPQDQRGVVRVRPRSAHRERRGQHVEVNLADVQAEPYDGVLHLHSVIAEDVANDLDARGGLGQRTGDDLGNVPTMEDAGHSADVIHVVMTQQQQRNLVDVQVGQAPVDQHRIRSGVDHYGAAVAGRQHE